MKYLNQEINVLLIEDDPMVREVNKMFVNRVEHFHVIGTAADGDEGRKQVEQLRPDLVLLDIYMAKEDGLTCLKELRQTSHDVDVIAVTAANDTETVKVLLRYGVVDYIVKPFTFERMQKSLTQYLERRKHLQEAGEVSQDHIDELIHTSTISATKEKQHAEELPKGIHSKTLAQIIAYMKEMKSPSSAEAIGEAVGLARVTTRRYLNYLEKIAEVEMEMSYGQIGRPIQYYQLTKKGEKRAL
ncbi:response regulator [Salsuginibacillus kocurii]|uniref:response regulator n=1 Tax=Salsuginibacillus kocurii TaxID=427078 RepID=UPI00037211D0|nr:response regulator [Salsuginibacillus kocurii]